MNLVDFLQKELKKTGLPVAYSHFLDEVEAPFIIFFITGTEHIGDDYQVRKKRYKVTIELFTQNKNMEAEKKLEDIFDGITVAYETEFLYEIKENLFIASYKIIIDEGVF